MFREIVVLRSHRGHEGLIVDQRLESVIRVILRQSLVLVLIISTHVCLDFNEQSLALLSCITVGFHLSRVVF